MTHDRILGRYYLKPIIERLKASGKTQAEIETILGVSRSVTRAAIVSDMPSPALDEIVGSIDEERLRVAAVFRCMEILSARGWQVAESDPKCIFDVFAIKDRVIKIQVRSSTTFAVKGCPTFRTGKIAFNTTRAVRSAYSAGDFDLWFFYSKTGDCWLIPFDKVTTKSTVSMEGYDAYYAA